MNEVLAAIGLVGVLVLAADMVLSTLKLRAPLLAWARRWPLRWPWRLRNAEHHRSERLKAGLERREAIRRSQSAPVPLDEASGPASTPEVQWDGNVARPGRFDPSRRHNRH